MDIQQVSVFIENKAGRLAEVTRSLRAAAINIRSLSLADTSDFGVLRLIVDRPEQCREVLSGQGFVVRLTSVLAVEVADQPGGLDDILQLFDKHKLNVEYMYAFVEKRQNNAVMIFRFDTPEDAQRILKEQHIPLVDNRTLLQN